MEEPVLARIEISEYEEHAVLSNKRQPKYYRKGSKIPKKYKSYASNKKGFIVDDIGNRVLSNPRSAGTPRRWKINGQALYSGTLHHRSRSTVTNWAHSYLAGYMRDLPFINTPPEKLSIECEIHNVIPKNIEHAWDCSNQWIWVKWFEDTLVRERKILDDSIHHIRRSGTITFVPIDDPEKRKLVFIIKKFKL